MEYLEFTEQSTTQMLDICADLTMTQELRAATVAFLTDRYDDGTYVATADDITELQDATATFLTEHANGDCSCLGPVIVGLLLPDEQFPLPISDAVNRVRGAATLPSDLISLIDECVDAGWAYEDSTDSPLPDAAVTDLKPEAAVSRTLRLVASSDFVEDQSTLQEELYGAIDDLLGQRADMDSSADQHGNTDSDSTDDRMSKALFDASDIVYRFKASNAAAFFDPVADTVVLYASFDQLLDIKLMPPTAHRTDRATLKVITKLPTILEEEVQWSAASDSSIDFADHRGFLKSIESRRGSFLDADEELDDAEELHDDENELALCKTGVGDFDGLFGDDIWINAPDLDLVSPLSQPFFPQLVDEADYELLGALIIDLEAMLVHSSTEMPTLVADIKQRIHLLMMTWNASR